MALKNSEMGVPRPQWGLMHACGGQKSPRRAEG
jgi:hypothetical protein